MMVVRRASATDRNILYMSVLNSITSNLIPTMVMGGGSCPGRTDTKCWPQRSTVIRWSYVGRHGIEKRRFVEHAQSRPLGKIRSPVARSAPRRTSQHPGLPGTGPRAPSGPPPPPRRSCRGIIDWLTAKLTAYRLNWRCLAADLVIWTTMDRPEQAGKS
jgi:hypothetical protein